MRQPRARLFVRVNAKVGSLPGPETPKTFPRKRFLADPAIPATRTRMSYFLDVTLSPMFTRALAVHIAKMAT
jgi:hypothetical protein